MTKQKSTSGKFTIRSATENDLPILVDFLVKLALHVAGDVPQTLKPKEHRRLTDFLAASLVDDDKRVVVAELPDAGLVGMGYIHIWHSEGIWEQLGDQRFRTGIIDDIWVEPAVRQSGIFTAMLEALVTFADNRGVQELVLEYSLSNREAEATWKKLGFEVTGVRASAFTDTVKQKLAKKQRAKNEEQRRP